MSVLILHPREIPGTNYVVTDCETAVTRYGPVLILNGRAAAVLYDHMTAVRITLLPLLSCNKCHAKNKGKKHATRSIIPVILWKDAHDAQNRHPTVHIHIQVYMCKVRRIFGCIVFFYKKLKNVSCEYHRVNGWNSTLQAAWYIRHVRIGFCGLNVRYDY